MSRLSLDSRSTFKKFVLHCPAENQSFGDFAALILKNITKLLCIVPPLPPPCLIKVSLGGKILAKSIKQDVDNCQQSIT